jgi:diguanylate cyclase (GGDEF)-like protein
MLIGFGLRPNALSLLNGKGFSYPWMPAIAVAIWLVLYLFPWFSDDLALRVIFVNGLGVLALALCIGECRPRKAQAHFSSLFLIGVFFVDAMIRLSVILLFFGLDYQSLQDAFQTPPLTVVLVLLLFTIVLKVIGLGITVFEQLKREFQDQAQRDSLTGLRNRRAFLNAASEKLNCAVASSTSYSLVTIEIDNLQDIDSRFGTSMSEALVNLLGQLCAQKVASPAVIGRIRDSQISIFLQESDRNKASATASRICQSFASEATRASGNHLSVSVSSGVFWGSPQTTLVRAMEIADHCLKQAKQGGGNKILLRETREDEPLSIEDVNSPFAPRRPRAA